MHPVAIATNPARAPVVLDLSGEFKATDCRPFQFGSSEADLAAASHARRVWDLAESLQVGDVFQYDIALTFQNTDAAWAEIHPTFGIGNTIREHSEPVGELREPIAINWTGQSYRTSEDDPAFLRLSCHYGVITQPIPYTLTVTFTFADSAIPAEAPIRIPVPEGATRLFVRGVAVDPSKGVNSHFRVFGPDDQLVCECALSSAAEVTAVELAAAGDHVLLVDHTANGFVSVALDVPAAEPAEAMTVEMVQVPVLTADGTPNLDATVELDIPTVPLFMHAFVVSPEAGSPGIGKKTSLSLVNDRGEVLRISWGGHFTMPMPEGMIWTGIWPADWEYMVDHHAYAPGKHVAHVQAEALRGEIVLFTRQYVR